MIRKSTGSLLLMLALPALAQAVEILRWERIPLASRFMEGKPCPTCHGKRLKPEALSVTFAGVDIGEFMQMPLDQLAALLEPIAQGDFRAHAAGAATDKEATRRDRAERAASGRAVHAVSPDVRRTSALSEVPGP